MRLTRWLVVGTVAVFLGVTTVMAQEAGPKRDRKARAHGIWKQYHQTVTGIRQKENQLLQQNPDLRAAISDIDKQIRELQKQRKDKLAEADPGLAALYKKMDEIQTIFRQVRSQGMHGVQKPKND
ncbi:MAG: hypothetical protein GXP31_13670 [Kiritimatiellaeota bacterium]|nr:hypothetical protein [Kiritimatiellota bacterium]